MKSCPALSKTCSASPYTPPEQQDAQNLAEKHIHSISQGCVMFGPVGRLKVVTHLALL
jgi:hypothetical protein